MVRGNSKLYRIKREAIKEIPVVSNYYCEKAFNEGYMFIKETENNPNNEIRMISTTVSFKSFEIGLINVDIVEADGSLTRFRY